MSQKLTSAVLAAGVAAAAFTHAQDLCPCPKAPPEPAWKASVGGGLSLTGGNTNANSYNLSFSVTHDPRLRNIFKAEGLYLRTDQDGQATADKTSASLRDEYKFGRAYLFGQLAYLQGPAEGSRLPPLARPGSRLPIARTQEPAAHGGCLAGRGCRAAERPGGYIRPRTSRRRSASIGRPHLP